MEKMQNNKFTKICLIILLQLLVILDARSSNIELLSKLKIEKDIISAAIESINMINKSKLVSINSTTSESMLAYADLLMTLDSPGLLNENQNKLNDLMNYCTNAHRIYIKDSNTRIKDNLDLISELKEVYPDIFKSSFCIDSISKYTETVSAIEKFKSDGGDIYEIIKLIIMSDRTFALDINDFKTEK
jgi:hypothetical protein